MTPNNAQPPVTAQELRHIAGTLPRSFDAQLIYRAADQLEQHERELAALRTERDRWKQAYGDSYAMCAELRRDRERLDHWQKLHGRGPFFFNGKEFRTVREAVDAAIAAHKPEASKEDGA